MFWLSKKDLVVLLFSRKVNVVIAKYKINSVDYILMNFDGLKYGKVDIFVYFNFYKTLTAKYLMTRMTNKYYKLRYVWTK